MKAGIDELVGELKDALEGRFEIAEAYLFGSRARGEERAHSDVDVAVYLSEEPESAYGYDAELSAELMGVLGTNDVDVVVLNGAPPLLYHRVLRDGVRILSRDLKATTTREGRALSMYCDFAIQLRKVDAAAKRRSKHGEFGR